MYCKNCGKELKSENKFCPFCGTETSNMAEPVSSSDEQKKPKKKVWMVLPALVAAICIAFGVYRVVNIVSENGAKEEWVATVKEDGKWYVINGKNEKLAEIVLDNILDVSGFNEYGVAVVEVGQEENPDITYMNTDGEILTSLFESFTGYDAGVYWSIQSGDNWCCGRGIFEVDGKYGFIDTEGKIKVLPVYDDVCEFGKNGLAAVKMDDLWGYVNTEGEMVIELSYSFARSFSDNGLACVIAQNGEWCFIDSNGEIIIDTGYCITDCIVYSFDKNGFAQVMIDDGKMGIMNEKGVMIAEPIYSWVSSCSKDSIYVVLESKYGIVDAQGAMCVSPVYDRLLPLNENFYAVLVDDRYGIINKNGEEIVEPAYEVISYILGKKWIGFSDERQKAYLLDDDGTVIEKWESNEDDWYDAIYNRELDKIELFGVKTDGIWNFIDEEDRIRFKTKEAFEFTGGGINFTGSPIVVYSDDACGYIDANGKLMIDFQYEEANSFFDKGSLENLQI